jgi:hypothetical protein
MPTLEEDWTAMARTLGYETELDMLKGLYLYDQMSISEMAKVLGYSDWSVRRRLVMNQIRMRPRGGPNNAGKRRLGHLSDDEILNTPTQELMTHYNVNLSTVYAERRLRKCNSVQSHQLNG